MHSVNTLVNTLSCIPTSICSWNYRVRGFEDGEASLTFNRLTEQGNISIAGANFDVVKHGWLSGCWTLEHDGQPYATGKKPSAFTRTLEVESGELTLTLKPGMFSHVFEIRAGDEVLGRIRPAHLFTRRAFVECTGSVPVPVQLFSFWLVALMWRRQSHKNNKPGGPG